MRLIKYCLLSWFLIPSVCFSFYNGVDIHPNDYSIDGIQLVNLLKKYNFNSIRTDYTWDSVQPKGESLREPNNKVDQFLMIAKENGIEPVVILDYGNRGLNINRPLSDVDIKQFERYVAWTVNRFQGKVFIYEIWNEWPHTDKHYKNAQSDISAVQYVKLVSTVAPMIKKIEPNAKVIAGGYNPIDIHDKSWGDKIISLGILKYIDGLSLHPYTYFSKHYSDANVSNDFLTDYADSIEKKYSIKTNFYITEYGFSTYLGRFGYLPEDVESILSQFLHRARENKNIKGVWWYDLKDDGVNHDAIEDNFGLLDKNFSPKLQMKAFQ